MMYAGIHLSCDQANGARSRIVTQTEQHELLYLRGSAHQFSATVTVSPTGSCLCSQKGQSSSFGGTCDISSQAGGCSTLSPDSFSMRQACRLTKQRSGLPGGVQRRPPRLKATLTSLPF